LYTIWKGKKHHLPLKRHVNQIKAFAFLLALASTLDVVPDEINVPFLQNNRVRLCFLQTLEQRLNLQFPVLKD
jgi:hypothetical protein